MAAYVFAFVTGALCGGLFIIGVGLYRDRRRALVWERFVSFAAHELSTPLTAVSMTISNMLEGTFGPLSTDHQKWITMVREQMTRLSDLTADLRDLVQLQLTDELALSLEPAHVSAIVDRALNVTRRALTQPRGGKVSLALPASLPQVSVDCDRAVRLLTGLLFHARKFCATGDIAVRAVSQAPYVVIEVSYLGPRVSAGEDQRSLEIFYPARVRDNQALASVGLGLGVTRSLVRAQEGDLDCRIDLEGHCTLQLKFPTVML